MSPLQCISNLCNFVNTNLLCTNLNNSCNFLIALSIPVSYLNYLNFPAIKKGFVIIIRKDRLTMKIPPPNLIGAVRYGFVSAIISCLCYASTLSKQLTTTNIPPPNLDLVSLAVRNLLRY